MAVLLMLFGCTDLTEFDHSLKTGINIFHAPDLTVVNTIENISGARSLCVVPDCFIVATTEGTVIRFDLESHQQTGSFTIGSPSPSGYFEIEYSPAENTVYIIGAFGQIVELTVPDMEFLDEFIICEAPVDIEIASMKPYFYVAGANSFKIYEVSKANHLAGRYSTLWYSPTCMAIDQSQDTILVGTLDKTFMVSTGPGLMSRRMLDYFPMILAVQAISDDTNLCAVFDYSIPTIATIHSYFPPEGGPCWTGTAPIEGEIHFICTDVFGDYAYVFSYLGDNMSRLVSYNCEDYSIESQVDLEGYPLDLDLSPGGTLLVLTTE